MPQDTAWKSLWAKGSATFFIWDISLMPPEVEDFDKLSAQSTSSELGSLLPSPDPQEIAALILKWTHQLPRLSHHSSFFASSQGPNPGSTVGRFSLLGKSCWNSIENAAAWELHKQLRAEATITTETWEGNWIRAQKHNSTYLLPIAMGGYTALPTATCCHLFAVGHCTACIRMLHAFCFVFESSRRAVSVLLQLQKLLHAPPPLLELAYKALLY